MIPVKPFSVKLPPEVREKIKDASDEVGYSENQFIVDAMRSIVEMIPLIDKEAIPRVVVLVRAAQQHRQSPQRFRASVKPRRRKDR